MRTVYNRLSKIFGENGDVNTSLLSGWIEKGHDSPLDELRHAIRVERWCEIASLLITVVWVVVLYLCLPSHRIDESDKVTLVMLSAPVSCVVCVLYFIVGSIGPDATTDFLWKHGRILEILKCSRISWKSDLENSADKLLRYQADTIKTHQKTNEQESAHVVWEKMQDLYDSCLEFGIVPPGGLKRYFKESK